MYAQNMRSGSAIGEKLSQLADAMYAEGQRTDDIFGPVQHVPPKEIFKEVLGQDRKPQKMSDRMMRFWRKNGGRFLDGFFSGTAQDGFFTRLQKEYGRCH